ncbi:hypothetical protein Droror1_Dr00027054 [Drosera rotundifolia]
MIHLEELHSKNYLAFPCLVIKAIEALEFKTFNSYGLDSIYSDNTLRLLEQLSRMDAISQDKSSHLIEHRCLRYYSATIRCKDSEMNHLQERNMIKGSTKP